MTFANKTLEEKNLFKQPTVEETQKMALEIMKQDPTKGVFEATMEANRIFNEALKIEGKTTHKCLER